MSLPAFPILEMQSPDNKTDFSGGWIGREAPPFVLTDSATNRPVRMADVWYKRPVVLIFYRGGWSQSCVAQLAEIARYRREFAQCHSSLYALSNETPVKQSILRRKSVLPFLTFLSDPKGNAARQFAGVYAGESVAQPAVFVVRRGRIVYAYLNADTTKRAPVREILDALSQH